MIIFMILKNNTGDYSSKFHKLDGDDDNHDFKK